MATARRSRAGMDDRAPTTKDRIVLMRTVYPISGMIAQPLFTRSSHMRISCRRKMDP
jgi:hypothetical protein